MKKMKMKKQRLAASCKSIAWKAAKIGTLGAMALAIGCSGEESDSKLSTVGIPGIEKAEKKWDHGLYNLKKFSFTKAEDGHKSKWRDYLASTSEDALTRLPGVIFVRFEGRGVVSGFADFDKPLTIHCAFSPDVKDKPFDIQGNEVDIKQYNGQDSFVTPGIQNPCVYKGGIYKITTKAEFKSEDEEKVSASLEYLFSRNMSSAKPATRYTDKQVEEITTPKPVYTAPTKIDSHKDSEYKPYKPEYERDCHYYNNCSSDDYKPANPNTSDTREWSVLETFHYQEATKGLAAKTRFYDIRSLSHTKELRLNYTGNANMHMEVEPKIVCRYRFDGSYSENPLHRVGYTFQDLDLNSNGWTSKSVNLNTICSGARGGIETFLIKAEPASYNSSAWGRLELVIK